MFFGIELNLFVVCIIVVLGRIVDMALATIRTVFTVKGKPQIAAPIGFIEAFFWFLIVKAALDYVIQNPVTDSLLSWICTRHTNWWLAYQKICKITNSSSNCYKPKR